MDHLEEPEDPWKWLELKCLFITVSYTSEAAQPLRSDEVMLKTSEPRSKVYETEGHRLVNSGISGSFLRIHFDFGYPSYGVTESTTIGTYVEIKQIKCNSHGIVIGCHLLFQ